MITCTHLVDSRLDVSKVFLTRPAVSMYLLRQSLETLQSTDTHVLVNTTHKHVTCHCDIKSNRPILHMSQNSHLCHIP